MSEALCSGSGNALKSFSGHVSQDRSLHQDRAGPSAQPQISQFRNTDPNTAQAHDAHFHQQLGGPAPLSSPEMLLPLMPQQIPQQPHQHPQHAPQPVAHAAPAVPDWALQFQTRDPYLSDSSDYGNNNIVAAAPAQPIVSQPQQLPQQSYTHAPAPYFQPPVMTFHAQPPITREMVNSDFEAEMDRWMALNRPELRQQQNQADMEGQIDAEMDRLAQELEAQDLAVKHPVEEPITDSPMERQEVEQESKEEQEQQEKNKNQDELAEAAKRIVDVMDQGTSAKMKESGFLNLMRRLAEGDVVLKDQDFVDGKGEKVIVDASKGEGSADRAREPEGEREAEGKKPEMISDWEPIDLTRRS